MTAQTNKHINNIFLKMHPVHRVLISLICCIIAYFFLPKAESNLIKISSLWVVFAAAYLIMCWVIFFTRPVDKIRKEAAIDDGSRVFVFIMIILSSVSSMFTVLLLVISKDRQTSNSAFFVPASVFGMLLSWAMVHTLFTFNYAHHYYDDDDEDKTKYAGGLDFPDGNVQHDYIDFAYFSFVIGCTFQVSDVEISSRRIRRLVFLHQLISFLLNTFVVALTINLIAGLGH